jgi:hypothetical protein
MASWRGHDIRTEEAILWFIYTERVMRRDSLFHTARVI